MLEPKYIVWIGVVVQLVTLMGIIFTGGRFIGRVDTLINILVRDVADLKKELNELRR